jgi:GST-like protein
MAMIELHYWPTSNGHKITMACEEMALPYEIHPVNIGKGEQFKPSFIAISPNNRMPAIVDRDPIGGGAPLSIFESGAILVYLAEKSGKFMPKDVRGRYDVMQWLFWQVGGLGPMAGQKGHFLNSAPEKIPYAIDRYTKETDRLIGVLDRRLQDREFLCGAYTIADMASYPWTFSQFKRDPSVLDNFHNVSRWVAAIGARPATVAAYQKGEPLTAQQVSDDERKRNLYGQTAASTASRIGG